MTPRKKPTPSSKKRLCDDIVRKLVVSRGRCERCGDVNGPHQCAHIRKRRYSRTRTDLTNLWCLCIPCHQLVDSNEAAFMGLVTQTIGLAKFDELVAQSLLDVKFSWFEEHDRLRALVKARTP